MFLPLDETTGSVAYDISGCENNGAYSDGIVSGIFPLVPGGLNGTYINNTKYIDCSTSNDYYGQDQSGSFAQAGFSDNDFSLEIWIHPNFNTAENLIFGDQVNDIGISWEKGNVIFKLNTEILEYTLPYLDKAFHIVATYNVSHMYLYIDGILVAGKSIPGFRFTNDYLNLSIGPTASSSSYFIADAPAIYRYALNSEQIRSHYLAFQEQVSPFHIVYPDGGTLWTISDENTKEAYSIDYPTNFSFGRLLADGLTYDSALNSLYLTPTDDEQTAEVIVKDFLIVPLQDAVTRSKISWYGTNGISVFTSIDDDTYEECVNGEEVPQYAGGTEDGNGTLYLKIVFSSEDSSRFNPELYSLFISFYTTSNIFAATGGDYIQPLSTYKYSLGNKNYPLLARDKRNGLRIIGDGGFKISTSNSIKTVEFIYTKTSSQVGGFISGSSSSDEDVYYKWTNGTVSHSGIDALYINGVSSINSISSITNNEICHIVLVLSEDITGDILFNMNGSTPGKTATYKNIALYEDELTSTKILNHYNMYISRPAGTSDDTEFTVTEGSTLVHDNDWLVIQNV